MQEWRKQNWHGTDGGLSEDDGENTLSGMLKETGQERNRVDPLNLVWSVCTHLHCKVDQLDERNWMSQMDRREWAGTWQQQGVTDPCNLEVTHLSKVHCLPKTLIYTYSCWHLSHSLKSCPAGFPLISLCPPNPLSVQRYSITLFTFLLFNQ